MDKYFSYIRYFLVCKPVEKIKIFRISILLVKATFLVKYIPLKFYYSKFFFQEADHAVNLQPFQKDISLIYKIIRAAPWKVTCLIQSITMQSYFKRYKILIPVYLGVTKGQNGSIYAHAWNPIKNSPMIQYSKLNYNEIK